MHSVTKPKCFTISPRSSYDERERADQDEMLITDANLEHNHASPFSNLDSTEGGTPLLKPADSHTHEKQVSGSVDTHD